MTGATPSLGEATRLWLRVGLTSFGGPAGQIAQMHRLLVEERKWISETRFLHALNFCMLLPGPEAQQLATYIGWLLHGTRGGVIAGVLFILPGFFVLVALSLIYVLLGEVPLVAGLFFGLKAAVLAIVIEALQRVAKRALRNRVATLLAAVAFAAIFAFGVPFPVVVAAAALIGWQGARTRPDLFLPAEKKDAAGLVDRLIEAEAFHTRPDLGRAIRIALACLLLWFGPLVLAALWLGADHVLVTAGLFFSKMAVVTFGGAYAVLAYVGQEAVGHFGWLTPEDMLAGLALAETTPGPLILVLTFVGFLAAHGAAAPFDPVTAGLLGALVATWTTFVPCFLWILVGAPWVESLRGVKGLAAALSGITAAVVGVILNLAVFFAVHVLFETVGSWSLGPLALPLPDLASFDWRAGLIALGAMIATFRFHTGMIPTLVGAALAGVVLRVLL